MWYQKLLKFKWLFAIAMISASPVLSFVQSAQTTLPIVNNIVWNVDGTKLAVGYQFGPAEIFDPQTGKTISTISAFQLINSMAWNPANEDYLAIGGDKKDQSGVVEVIDIASNQTVQSLDGGASVLSVIWSPDGNQIAASSNPVGNSPTERSEVRIWDAKSGALLLTAPPVSNNSINAITWSPNGEQIAGATSDHVVVIWDANTGEILHTLEHDDVVLSVAWSPDGNKLASTSTNADSGLRIWDTTSWNVLTTLPSKFGTVSWNPNGNELAVGEYLFVKVLDAESGQEIISLPTDKLEKTVAYSPYGGRLAFGGEKSPYADTTVLTSPESSVQTFADGAVQIIVPTPSIEKLRTIVGSCGLAESTAKSLATAVNSDNMGTFTTAVEAAPTGAIPPACAADLIAVAEALQNQ